MGILNLDIQEKKTIKQDFNTCVDRFMTLDDNKFDLDFPVNAIEWAASEKFQGLNRIFTNRGQYYALRKFFQCYCPICSDITDSNIFDVSEKAVLNDSLLVLDWSTKKEHCPECGLTKDELIEEGLLTNYNTLLGVVGMRAGKTMLASIIMTYAEQFFIHLGDCRVALGLEKVPFIELACIAVSASQAKDTIWAQYKELRESSDWFKSLDGQMNDLGYVKSGDYDLSAGTVVRNKVNGYKVTSLSSSSASIAGRTRGLFVVDELGRFDTTESKRSAKEVWRVGNNSLKTVRKMGSNANLPVWLGAMVAIESPISVDDFGMQMYKGSENAKNLFKMKFATWEFNREYDPEDFDEDFELDYHGAQRDYGADPPGSEVPYIEDWNLFLKLTEVENMEPLVFFEDMARYEGDDICYLGKRVGHAPVDQSDWFIAGDAGKSHDTFALVGCRRIWRNDGEFDLEQGFAMHILPNANKRLYVDFTCIEDLLIDLCKKLNVIKITFDYWQSESLIQSLKKKGYPAEQYAMSSLKVGNFFAFKQAVESRRVKLLPRKVSEDGDSKLMDSQTRLYWEMKRMQRSKDLKKIDHSKKSTSDLVECVVNCYRLASDMEEANRKAMDDAAANYGGTVRFNRW